MEFRSIYDYRGCGQRIVDLTSTKREVDTKTESCRFTYAAGTLRL